MADTHKSTAPSTGASLGVMAGGALDVRYGNPGGLTGVWAEENTRASIWDAMYRKETFGVSGPHIKVRFFGGWGYKPDILKTKDWVHQSYANGVPMGGDLQAMPSGKGVAPTFVVWAVKDPTSGNLDRIQLIKGWSKNGQSFEKIYDVVWSGTDRKADKWSGRVPAIKSTVDLEKATYTNDVGSTELSTVWTDPDFDSRPARFLLRPRAGNSYAALDADPSGKSGPTAAARGSSHRTGTRLELANLVHTERRCSQGGFWRHDRG
jgi:hypothetical protein